MTALIAKKDFGFSKCPSCKNKNSLHRSHSRNWRETLVKATKIVKIYRCGICGWRGYMFAFYISSKELKKVAFYSFLALIAAGIVYYLLNFMIK